MIAMFYFLEMSSKYLYIEKWLSCTLYTELFSWTSWWNYWCDPCSTRCSYSFLSDSFFYLLFSRTMVLMYQQNLTRSLYQRNVQLKVVRTVHQLPLKIDYASMNYLFIVLCWLAYILFIWIALVTNTSFVHWYGIII
jgi:hypothetical protein